MPPASPFSLAQLEARRLVGSYFQRSALEVAADLVGAWLVGPGPDAMADAKGCPAPSGLRVARIVETEAYCGPEDGACHARVGLTKRTRTLLGPPGFAYVFLIYGMHTCMNVVCGQNGLGHAVLLRAAEPLWGFPHGTRMNGPGRLTRAMGILREHDGANLEQGPLFVAKGTGRGVLKTTPRVGVAYAGPIANEPWRFLEGDSPHVSKPSPRTIGDGSGAKKLV